MQTPKKYIHDRVVLLLLSVNSFLTLLGTALVFLRIDSGKSGDYIVQYRANLGISAFKSGRLTELLAFVVFLVLILVINTFLSMRIYEEHRSYAIVMLGLGTLLAVLSLIVSNALLVLR